MAIQYIVTEAELLALVEGLELAKLRKESDYAPKSVVHKQDIDDLHRVFHYHVVRWIQAVGHKGYRG